MLGDIWNSVLVNPLFTVLMGIYQFTDSLGISIIILTILIRALMIPAMLPTLKTAKKQRDLMPEIQKLKEKYKDNQQELAKKQLELYKEHGINPASGCASQIVTIIVLIALYGVISKFSQGLSAADLNTHIYLESLKLGSEESINTNFGYLNLSKTDPFFILAILAGVTQFIASKMQMPYVDKAEQLAKKTTDKNDDLAYNIQQQMVYTMPVMNFVIGLTLPAGMVLYIVTTTIFTVVQTYYLSGLGGIKPWVQNFKKVFRK